MSKLKAFTVRIDDETDKQIQNISNVTGDKYADVARDLIKTGLATKLTDNSIDMISKIIREQLEIVLKPSVERLAALSSKTGHMSATATFLNVQALMDLVPKENRKDVRGMYDNARKKAVEYMKTPTSEWNKK